MNIGARLEAIGKLVLKDCVLADIGTDHAYLPVNLLLENKIESAIAGDIAQGPCRAAENTVALYNLRKKVQVRHGSGLKVLKVGEADCISIAGMGGSTIVEILAADLDIAKAAKRLVLQPQTGAPGLRKWLIQQGWQIVEEELIWDNNRLYEIIVAERSEAAVALPTQAELEIGPVLLAKNHSLLLDQFAKILDAYNKQLSFMEKSENAVKTDKYAQLKQLVNDLEALKDACKFK